jgi:hypothetical protein
MNDISIVVFAILILSIIVSGLDLFFMLIAHLCMKKSQGFGACRTISSTVHGVIIVVALALNIALYSLIVNHFMMIDYTKLDYLASNTCFDGILDFSVQKYRDEYSM